MTATRGHASASNGASCRSRTALFWRFDLLYECGVATDRRGNGVCAPGFTQAASISEAAFAMLDGVAPIPANSGQVTSRYG